MYRLPYVLATVFLFVGAVNAQNPKPKPIPITELRKGGIPSKVRMVKLKSGAPILLVTETAAKTRWILKMVDFESGQPVTLQPNQMAFAKVEDEESTWDVFRNHLKSRESFLVTVHPIRDNRLIRSEERKIVVITANVLKNRNSPSMRIQKAYESLFADARRLLKFQHTKVKPLSFRLDEFGNDWHKFDKQDELRDALRLLAVRRQQILVEKNVLEMETIAKEIALNAETDRLADELSEYLDELGIYDGLHRSIERKLVVIQKFQEEARALSQNIQQFQKKYFEPDPAKMEELYLEFRHLMLKADLMRSSHDFALQAVVLQHAIAEQELNDYQAWLESEAEAEQQVDESYYEEVDYGGNLSGFQLMHRTARMQFDSSYGDNWNHRPATDGRQ